MFRLGNLEWTYVLMYVFIHMCSSVCVHSCIDRYIHTHINEYHPFTHSTKTETWQKIKGWMLHIYTGISSFLKFTLHLFLLSEKNPEDFSLFQKVSVIWYTELYIDMRVFKITEIKYTRWQRLNVLNISK